ncbi:uncharacterized protein LOC121760742 [Salvia splendens]|uniref:uncharacterized protein LOC121760742 n=1 Tax=Salvia splendens TaxID=180675 RepID=UPI001C26A91E|nr:uncharacterized protein LOC121760742 [Salvia splendens]
MPTPTASPKTIKPFEAESPKPKPLSRPPSPLTLPPAQTKLDILEDKPINRTLRMSRTHNNGIASDGKREPNTPKDNSINKKLSNPEQQRLRVITLAGENKGAVMELSTSHKKTLQNGKQTSGSGSDSGEEGKSRSKDKANGAQPPMSGWFNSNVQGLNNSILYNSNIRHKDPGIHISVSRKGSQS